MNIFNYPLSDLWGTYSVYEVNTNLNNVLKLDMIFDTGAGEVQFSRDIFQTLIKTKTISVDDILEGGYYQDANGNVNYNVRFNLRQMKIGNVKIENIPCCVAKDENGANLLGLSALKKLGKFEFDFDKSVINLK
jgi:clan AA aspartic protease (TIGR02281 family)